MPTSFSTYELLEGSTQTTETSVTIVSAGSAGTPSCLRTLEHPDSANFPIVTYNRNPDRTINFDQEPLYPPSSRLLKTLGTTQALLSPNELDDVLVTEIWQGNDNRSPMVAAQFRRLYELIINPPAPATPEEYIQWSPCDRTDVVYNVILVDLRVGGGSGSLDVRDVGLFAAGDLDEVATGLLDRTVELDLKLISEVTT